MDAVGFDNDGLLTQLAFIDPVTLDVINKAVRANDGCTYDETTALDLINKKSLGARRTPVTNILGPDSVLQKSIDDFVTALERAHRNPQANQAPPAQAITPPQEPNPQDNRRQINDLTWGFIEKFAKQFDSPSKVCEITEAELGIKNNYDAGRLFWSLLRAEVVSNYQELKELLRYYDKAGILIPNSLIHTQSLLPVPFEEVKTLKSMLGEIDPQLDLIKLQYAFKELFPNVGNPLSKAS